jgi:predicted nuclease of predicted toxin-antitoxin system
LKLLLDTGVWGGAIEALVTAGHDVVWAGGWAEDPGDAEILDLAHAEGRILVTLDKDFGELAVLHQRPHFGILRLVNWPARQQAQVCLRVLDLYGEELQGGAIVTTEPGRIRIRSRNEE